MGRLDALIALVSGTALSGFVVLLVLAALGVFGATDLETGAAAGDGYSTGAAQVAGPATHPLLPAWRNGEAVNYLDFGAQTSLDEAGEVATASIYLFITGFDDVGAPVRVPDQPTLSDVVPGDAGYSDLWDVQFVHVPASVDVSQIRSLEALEASGLEITSSGMLPNCPFVPDDTETGNGSELHKAWYDGELRHYVHAGRSATTPGDAYAFITGFDEQGEPVLATLPPLIDDEAAGDLPAHFLRLHYVTVPAGVDADSIRSVEALEAAGLTVTASETLVNWPVIEG